jgi:hypothetical protein
MHSNTSIINSLPTEIRGCFWDDGWEFDGPCIIYYPKKYSRYGFGNNNSGLDRLVEDICDDIELGNPLCDGGLKEQIRWNGWGKRFDRRKSAEHITFKIEWQLDIDGHPVGTITKRILTMGPPPKNNKVDEQGS